MITESRRSKARPEAVWDVIADGWSYAAWVVGASRIRAVEGGWPAVGAKIHHSLGAWPVLLSDDTMVVSAEPGRSIRLQARSRPFGEAVVEIELHAQDGGTEIVMSEDANRGAARFVPYPLRAALLGPRNAETLRRLALLAEGREGRSGVGAHED